MDVRLTDTDAQGHMTSAAYLQFANHALWACVREAGVDTDALRDAGIGPVLLETTIRFVGELRGGDVVDVTCQLIFGSGKTYLVVSELRRSDRSVAATVTSTCGLLDLARRRLLPEPASAWRDRASRPEVLGLRG
jgi:acyl-CoA thioester hydrolase